MGAYSQQRSKARGEDELSPPVMAEANQRRLKQAFKSICDGKDAITARNAKHFLLALLSQDDVVQSVSELQANISALQNAMRVDVGDAFLNDTGAKVINYLLGSKDLKIVMSGTLLHSSIKAIVEPPIFWNAFKDAFRNKRLYTPHSQLAFGHLLWYLCSKQTPDSDGPTYRDTAEEFIPLLLSSDVPGVPEHARAVSAVLDASKSAPLPVFQGLDDLVRPGGRHDNDFPDFREIKILPTSSELDSKELAFLRPSSTLEDPETFKERVAIHLDNQFRLLREDMIYEMREEWQIMTKKKKGFRRGMTVRGLTVVGIECGEDKKRNKWALVVGLKEDLPQLAKGTKKGSEKDRKTYLKEHPKLFKHQSLACLTVDDTILGFATINRDEDRLAKKPPQLVLEFDDRDGAMNVLRGLGTGAVISLTQIDTATFAYEPVLRALQNATSLPLSSELLQWDAEKDHGVPRSAEVQVTKVVNALQNDPTTDLGTLLGLSKSIKLDASQAKSLLAGLTQAVSLIQGPPGTGKSFIGALLAKSIYTFTSATILVVCYTNHALDDILESLQDIGIPDADMVRLGGKSTQKTEPLLLSRNRGGAKRTKAQWSVIDSHKATVEVLHDGLVKNFTSVQNFTISYKDVLEYLEFVEPDIHGAFVVPESSSEGFKQVDRKGHELSETYLIHQWHQGWNGGRLRDTLLQSEYGHIWAMKKPERMVLWGQWVDALFGETIETFSNKAREYNKAVDKLIKAQRTEETDILRSKRVVGCTTTAAAKYGDAIRAFNPDLLLVEEAGEILESHVLTALGPETSQIILIGDHKQLRPKVNNYALTVEKGEGYDLNRSLFERLILKNYPHSSLSHQHRMRPEISALVRELTYPELADAPSTQNRPNIYGVRDNLVFIQHEKPEDDLANVSDRADEDSKASKQNSFETAMVLKIVRYLAQQGYGTDKLVVLTPYLGQLSKLRDALKKDNDPVLNDLDSFDLVKAGLIDSAAAQVKKRPIRLATIDNYQGEEADIVIVSLTRSNSRGDIGFMSSPERVNVMLSRARNALIMIGNSTTFRNARSKQGKELWTKLISMLQAGNHVYEGLPIQCDRHPDKVGLMKSAEDFDLHCPDGGCDKPCGAMLACTIHACESKCHQISDHSKMACEKVTETTCSVGHTTKYKCQEGPPEQCRKCERDAKLAAEKAKQEAEAEKRRLAEQAAHFAQLDALNAEIEKERRRQEEARSSEQRNAVIEQKKKELEDLKTRFQATTQIEMAPTSILSPTPILSPFPPIPRTSPPSSASVSGTQKVTAIQQSEALSQQDGSDVPQYTLDGSDQPSVSGLAGAPAPVVPRPKNTPPRPFPPTPPSPSKTDWERQKQVEGASNPALDAIMDLTGLESVKKQILAFKSKIDTSLRQGTSCSRERFNTVFLGNPGTGKTTVARHFAKFLGSVKATPADTFVEVTGSSLANEGVDGTKKMLEALIKSGGGVFFIDEAYQLTSGNSVGGGAVLDYLLAEMENRIGTVVFVLAGYNREMEKFFEHNPGLKSRVPHQIQFEDYQDNELMSIFQNLVRKEWNNRMRIVDGDDGLYVRILIRRMGRKRKASGFGNARDVHVALSKVRERQAERLKKELAAGIVPDDFLITAEDLIGSDPSQAIKNIKAWDRLQQMIGLTSVKQSVQSFILQVEENYVRELAEQEPIAVSLNRVFLGSPGTGKTTVAKMYGEILASLGLLSSGEVIVKNPSDFVGAVLGASEAQTKGILSNAIGKVLIIDEAYMLYEGGTGSASGGSSNQFKTTVIDTIVAEVQSVPGEDRCVLLLGYRDQMQDMFQNVNPGLARRFKIEDAFNFEDFTDQELLQIMELKLKDQDLAASDKAKQVAIEVLNRERSRPNFGNGGSVENLISGAKTRCLARRGRMPAADRSSQITFEPEDIDPDYNRAASASENLGKLFEDVIGCGGIVQRLRNYQTIAQKCKSLGFDPRDQIPTNFVFTGPPGTGKTTVARKMGQVFFDMGLLGSPQVIECSASDLVGQYVGQTGPKTKKLLEKALGRVLFVDEAYRLGEGPFAQEAVDELVGLITQTTFKNKLIIILAGYERDMNALMKVNTGLSSRFPDQVVFTNMDAAACLEVVRKLLVKSNVHLSGLDDPVSNLFQRMEGLVTYLSDLPDWGNARDMTTLAKSLVSRAFLTGVTSTSNGSIELDEKEALGVLKEMVDDRDRRAGIPAKQKPPSYPPTQTQTRQPSPPPPTSTSTATKVDNPAAKPQKTAKPEVKEPKAGGGGDGRDPGVDDATWNAMQAAIKQQSEVEKKKKQELLALEQREASLRRDEEMAKKTKEELHRKLQEEKDAQRINTLKNEREQARLKEIRAAAARAQAEAELQARREAQRKAQEEERRMQAKLKQMGVCSAGFRWINMGSYYRCGGGSHSIPISQLQ